MSTSSEPDGRGTYHHGDLRRALLAATDTLIRERGPAAVTLRAAAQAAGVSHNAPYRHFDGRASLLAAVAANGFHELTAALDATIEHTEGAARVAALGRAYVAFALRNPNLYRLMFGSEIQVAAYPDLAVAAQTAFTRLQEAIGRMETTAPREATIGAWALVHGLAQLLVEGKIGGGATDDNSLGALVDIVTMTYASGLAARG